MPVPVTGYLSVAQFRVRTLMPQATVDALEVREPDFLQTTLNTVSTWLNARLAKQYAVPFSLTSPPEIVLGWLTAIVTPLAYGKAGWQPSGESDKSSILDPAVEAKAEVKEAADAKDGLFELPLRSDTTAAGATRTAPLGYSEASPYAWTNEQLTRAITEDGNR